MKRILWSSAGLFVVIAIGLGALAANAAPNGSTTLRAGQTLTIRANGCTLKVKTNTPALVVVLCKARSSSHAPGELAPEGQVTLTAGQKQKVLPNQCNLSVTKKTASVVGVKCMGTTNTRTYTPTNTLTRTYTPTNTLTRTYTPTKTNTPTMTRESISPPASVAAGNGHACALTATGGVKCWGHGSSGQLGTGEIADLDECGNTGKLRCSRVPLWVMDMTSGVTKVVAGGSTTCAITTANALKCWGDNYYGQIGDGTTINRIFPVSVTGMSSDVVDVSIGNFHTCAIKSDHKVYCWGWNGVGALGDGTTDQHLTPVQVLNLSGAQKITVGSARSCALLDTGGVKCWGNWPLGDNNDYAPMYSTTPVDVVGFTSGASAVDGGASDTCLLTTGNGAMCWGMNTYGELGTGSSAYANTPQQVFNMESGVSQISTGDYCSTCAIVTGGALKCWGYNGQGQVGNGNTTDQHYPVPVQGLSSGVSQVSAGGGFSCAIASGVLKCWGDNYVGELGNNSYSNSNVPVNVIWTQ